MRKISGLIAVLMLALTVSSCGGGGSGLPPPPPPSPPPPPTCPTGTFCMGSSIFYTVAGTTPPITLTVAINAPVTWTNDSGVSHDVTFDNQATALAVGNGSSGNVGAPASGSTQRRFAAAGSYPFHCVQHAPGMTGTVIVQQ